MGVDLYVLKFLCHCHGIFGPFGRTLQLGRQGIYFHPNHREMADAIVRERGIGSSFEAVGGDEPFAERLYRSLGATEIVAGDASPYEGATFIHDFNEPLPLGAPEPFDTVVDGGSLEHIFNTPVALANLMKLTRVGGHILSINGANNFLGHGLYQFSPDLAFRVFSPSNGFEMLGVYLVGLDDHPTLVEAVDPALVRRRIEIRTTTHPTYLMFAARKSSEVPPFRTWPQQTDYDLAWKG